MGSVLKMIIMFSAHVPIAAFFNKANTAIEATLDSVDDIFQIVRKGILPTSSFRRPDQTRPPMSEYWADLSAQAMSFDRKTVDEILSTKR